MPTPSPPRFPYQWQPPDSVQSLAPSEDSACPRMESKQCPAPMRGLPGLVAVYEELKQADLQLQKQRLEWMTDVELWLLRQPSLLPPGARVDDLHVDLNGLGAAHRVSPRSRGQSAAQVSGTVADSKVDATDTEHTDSDNSDDSNDRDLDPFGTPFAPGMTHVFSHTKTSWKPKLGLEVNLSLERIAQSERAIRQSRGVGTATIENRTKKLRRWVAALLNNVYFEVVVAMFILINSVTVGLEVDYLTQHPGSDPPLGYKLIGQAFDLFLAVEIVLRIFVVRCGFFSGEAAAWNLFDLVLVACSLFEIVVGLVTAGHGFDHADSLRIMRIMRVVRVLRVLRIARILRLMVALRLLFLQILGTLKSAFWAMMLLVLILYAFGIVFAQMLNDPSVRTMGRTAFLEGLWGSVPRSMNTLYMCVSGGIDWRDAVEPLWDLHFGLLVLFHVYLAFTLFAVLNVVVGVFCHSAISSAEADPDNAVSKKIAEKQRFVKACYTLFKEIDDSGDGELCYQELAAKMTDDRVLAYFELLGLDHTDSWDLFKLMDKDQSSTIDLDQFVAACLRLRGGAKAIDVAKARHENRRATLKILKFMRKMEQSMKDLRRLCGSSTDRRRRTGGGNFGGAAGC